jgi:hypothetical protein
MRLILTLSLFCLITSAQAQWQQEWSSPAADLTSAAGWVGFQQVGDSYDYRYYTIDSTEMIIYSGAESPSPQYTYTFTPAEQLAGNNIYSFGEDLTGDGIVEFYVVSYAGTSDNYRQSFKVINIVSGETLFTRDNPSVTYGYPSVWDADGDGMLECTFSRANYPAATSYSYEVFNTGVSAGVNAPTPVPLNVELAQNFPNPFNPETTIRFSLGKRERVRISIYNSLGRLVKELPNTSYAPGAHVLPWDGTDSAGMRQASGPYFYSLDIDGRTVASKKMILLR